MIRHDLKDNNDQKLGPLLGESRYLTEALYDIVANRICVPTEGEVWDEAGRDSCTQDAVTQFLCSETVHPVQCLSDIIRLLKHESSCALQPSVVHDTRRANK